MFNKSLFRRAALPVVAASMLLLAGCASMETGKPEEIVAKRAQAFWNARAAGQTDKAYALFRAINCYAPAGYNSCGGQDVEPAVRKAWFRQLKTGFADTQWGKSLQYYW